jgi:hypothetical protein
MRMIKFSKMLLLLTFCLGLASMPASAQYYVKKKKNNASEQTTEEIKKPELTAESPLQEGVSCSEDDLKNVQKLQKGLDQMKDAAENKNPKGSREMVDYLSNPENIQYMTRLYARCAHLL